MLAATILVVGMSACLPPPSSYYERSERRPLFVLYRCSYWGSGNCPGYPSLVGYDDGLVIACSGRGWEVRFSSTHLSPRALHEILNALPVPDTFYELRDLYDLTQGWSDQPILMIYVADSTRSKRVIVRGGLDTKERRDLAPRDLVALYDALVDLTHSYKDGAEWFPAEGEVIIWRAGRDDVPAHDWPENFPTRESPRTIDHGEDYHVIVDSVAYREFPERFGGHFPIVRIDGLLWTTELRAVLPGQALWLEPEFSCH